MEFDLENKVVRVTGRFADIGRAIALAPKRRSSTIASGLIVAVSLANLCPYPTLQAGSQCPGGAASLIPRFIRRTFIVVPVMINGSGPYDFLVDTGTQVTVVDPPLAVELGLNPQGTVGLVSVASHAQASVTVLDRLQAGSRTVEKPLAIIQDLQGIQTADRRIRGVLGENFLAHFDLLIDYPHKLLCLDETNKMRESVSGEHIPLVPAQDPLGVLPFTERLDVLVRLSGVGSRQILLQLDSGSDSPIIYAAKERPLSIIGKALPQGGNLSTVRQAFAIFPPQDLQIGRYTICCISFLTPVSPETQILDRQEDGVLPTALFQRIFISSSDHYVMFDFRTTAAGHPLTALR